MEERVTVQFDENKEHAWINSYQYVSLERFLEVKKELCKEQNLLIKQVNTLLEENNAYKVLLREQLNKEE
jgi:hypothetical protein